MHTSSRLTSSDFGYRSMAADGVRELEFGDFAPGYHVLDRVGIVSPGIGDGIRHSGCAILALTTAFYDGLRSRQDAFFDYPQHFAFIDVNEDGALSGGGRLAPAVIGDAWGNLDVWPDNKWVHSPGSAAGMLKRVFDHQINRLFWPEGFGGDGAGPHLPAYARRMLETTLKSVLYYRPTEADLLIEVTTTATDLIDDSIQRLSHERRSEGHAPLETVGNRDDGFVYAEGYRRVAVEAFLDEMEGCFVSD